MTKKKVKQVLGVIVGMACLVLSFLAGVAMNAGPGPNPPLAIACGLFGAIGVAFIATSLGITDWLMTD